MKSLILYIAYISVSYANLVYSPLLKAYEDGDRYFYYSRDDDNSLSLIDAQENADEEFLRGYSVHPQVDYLLFTRSNPKMSQTIVSGNKTSLFQTYFDGRKNSVILFFGWRSSPQTEMIVMLTKAFLENDDVNIIVVDWSSLSQNGYITSMRGVPVVGKAAGDLVNWIVYVCSSYNSIHLVGYSLGAHIAGVAGRNTRSRVRRITGLDPAGPLFGGNSNRLMKTDAVYVEVIHTNTLFLGYRSPCGHADFYPNGGGLMRGCLTITCSHAMAYMYMYASVRHNHMHANECTSLWQATGLWPCGGSTYPMGNSDLKKSRSGLFRIKTTSSYPYF